MWCGSGRTGRERLRSDSECSTYDEECKIVIVGSSSVGKTALCHTFVTSDGEDGTKHLQKSSKGRRAEFDTWETVDGETCCMRLFELRMAAQGDDDEQIVRSLTQSADGFILVYSITDKRSFDAASRVHEAIHKIRNNSDTPLVLVGNKGDAFTEREVLVSDGRDMAFDIGTAFYETSTRMDMEKVRSIFHDVIRQVRCVRSRSRCQEQACNKVRGFIHRLSLRSKRKSLKRQSTG
ncbi:ras-related protein Rap1-like [Haliotis cracherodii]|uniref:ras-related protein Rap1-like n=2 Tax=Haliotis TaxID=6452 RepID=UPI001EB09D5D